MGKLWRMTATVSNSAGSQAGAVPGIGTGSRAMAVGPAGDRQRTLAQPARVEGVGLFSGKRSAVVMRPAPAGQGIAFRRADVPGSAIIPARVEHLDIKQRRTALAVGGVGVETVEHVLSALGGMGIDNAVVEVEGLEVPMGDGSALEFVEAIGRAGVVEQEAGRVFVSPGVALSVQDGPACITYCPPASGGGAGTKTLELTYVLDFGDASGTPGETGEPGSAGTPGSSSIARQAYTCVIEAGRYAREIAPARTFSTRAEAEAAARAGMFSHVSAREMLVIGPDGPVDNAYRFSDEPARHKLLDLLGDLMLVGGPLAGRVVAVRSGHALNHAMARAIREAVGGGGAGRAVAELARGPTVPAMDVRQIAGTLPHRYPMLLVDRVLTLESGKRAVGIKNVSINEPYFVGHYPAAPIMPGVLVCEAMAQLAGLMLKDVMAHQGKVALLLAMDEVRWRRAVVPGDQLVLEATANKANARMADVSCRASVDGQTAAEARLKFMVVDPSQVGPGGGASGNGETGGGGGCA